MKYESPEIEIIRFESEDVIRTSIKLPPDESASPASGSMFNLF